MTRGSSPLRRGPPSSSAKTAMGSGGGTSMATIELRADGSRRTALTSTAHPCNFPPPLGQH